jgi:type III pantothenate kinase
MNLVIDIGNTSVKLHLFENDEKVISETLNENTLIASITTLAVKYSIQNVIISSVTSNYKTELTKIFKNSNLFDLSDDKIKLPFINSYKNSGSLGQDRVALISSAVFNYQNQNNLVIDLGTCITYDFIDLKGTYLGGAISPGITTRYKSLNQNTSNLPLLEFENIEKILGLTTSESIQIGVIMELLEKLIIIYLLLKKVIQSLT